MSQKKAKQEKPALNEKEQQLRALQEKNLMKVNVIGLSLVFAAATCFMWFGKRPTHSSEENRDLAKMPKFSIASYLEGTFTSEFSAFFNDTVPMRSTFKGVISDFRGNLGIAYDDGVELVGDIPTLEEPEPTEPPTTVPPTQPPTQDATGETMTEPPTTEPPTTEPPEEDINGESANNILIVKDRGIMLFGGGKAKGEAYAGILNQYHAVLGDDVNIYSLVAPTACSYYLPKKYADLSASEPEHIDHINTFFEGVTPVDAYSKLLEHKDEAIYSRTDHHSAPIMPLRPLRKQPVFLSHRSRTMRPS